MTLENKLWTASKCAAKGWDWETLRYSDDLYNEQDVSNLIDDIWEYVDEIREEGRRAFYEKYKQYKLY